MTRTSTFRQQDILVATVLLATMCLPVSDVWATPILYFSDRSSGGGGGGGGGGGAAGGMGSGSAANPRTSSGTPTFASTSQTESDAAASGPIATGSGESSRTGGTGAGGSASVSRNSSPISSNPFNSADPVTNFFENLSMDLGQTDVLEGPTAAPLAQAFDAAEIISNVANVNVPDVPAGTGREAEAPAISFGAPETGVTLTIQDFVPGVADASLAVHMPEPASLVLLGTGLLLTAQYRRLRRRRTNHVS